MVKDDIKWESVFKMANSKWVWAQRITGWTILLCIIGILGYSMFMIISSRNQTHTEQVLVINNSVAAWSRTYVDEVKKWLPSLINENKEAYPFDLLNTPDFMSQYSDVMNYTIVKYYNSNITQALAPQSLKVIGNPNNGEFNITTTLGVAFDDGASITTPDLPIFVKAKSPRSQKDWINNRIGIWNFTDGAWYVFSQLTNVWYIIDQDNYPNLIKDYDRYPWDGMNRWYANYAYFRWNDETKNPTVADLSQQRNITTYLRSNKDPFVIGYTEADIVKNYEDNTLLLYGLILTIVWLIALFIPIKLILTPDVSYAKFNSERNSRADKYIYDWDGDKPQFPKNNRQQDEDCKI